MADFLVVIGGNLVSSWRPHNHDLTYVLLKGSPKPITLGIGLSMGLGGKGHNVFFSAIHGGTVHLFF